ncbi:MAG TPA: hypothetical protein VJ203_09710 [Bacteroidales bacterium]|nr:hypothetical protein [Bacteroidales bacterium]
MKSTTFRKSAGIVLFVIVCMALLASCANNEVVDPCLTGHKYGFWGGLLHGIIAPIDFVLMLFRDNITLYAQNNNGAWYAFGFLIGSGGWGFMGGKGVARRRDRS